VETILERQRLKTANRYSKGEKMATASAPILEQARREVTTLEGEISALKIRLATEESDLAALRSERADLAEKIALGEAPASKASGLARRVEESETRIAGFRSIIARKQGELDTRYPELRRVEAETKLAARRAEVESLEKKGVALVETINQTITELLTQDFVAFDEVRDELAKLGDVGGSTVAQDLLVRVGNGGESSVLKHLINQQRWMEGNVWELRSDLILTLRNLWPPKERQTKK
jgi:DNA repair exonuclease SbcCD ATPase subunit